MSEDEWTGRDLLGRMLDLLADRFEAIPQRQFLLLGCAACRRVEHLVDEAARAAIGAVECYALGAATADEARAAIGAIKLPAFEPQVRRSHAQFHATAAVARLAETQSAEAAPFSLHAVLVAGQLDPDAPECFNDYICGLFRCLFGNPFRPVTFDAVWRTATAVLLARQMYDTRDFSALPILADALQDAGCDNDELLNHCRAPNASHARGCWVVDLVLGKE